MIGEVWLCTGQSNMEFPVAHDPKVKWKTGMLGEAEVMKDADYPEIRLFHVEHQLAHEKNRMTVLVNGLSVLPKIYVTFRL